MSIKAILSYLALAVVAASGLFSVMQIHSASDVVAQANADIAKIDAERAASRQQVEEAIAEQEQDSFNSGDDTAYEDDDAGDEWGEGTQ